MKCRQCTQKAAINMRQHKLALCKDHFLEWIPEQVQRTIRKYQMFNPQDQVLVAVSGGKDSLSLWDILTRLGYQADGIYIGLGIDEGIGYSVESQRRCVNFAQERNLRLRLINIKHSYGKTVSEMAHDTRRGRGKPCSVCGITKRHIMNHVARDENYHVLVTGHNLDDEAAFLFGNTLNWISGYLARQWPVLFEDRPGVVRKAKPLCRVYEREMAAYAILTGIDYINDECPFAQGSKSIYYKEILNRMEADRPGTKLSFYLSFLKSKRDGLFAPDADPDIGNIHQCPTCGGPTSAPDSCTFCRMMNKAKL